MQKICKEMVVSVLMACIGICPRYKARKEKSNESRYVNGQKRCQICSIFIAWDGLRCPCCGQRLRLKPRSTKYKKAFRNELKEQTVLAIAKSKRG